MPADPPTPGEAGQEAMSNDGPNIASYAIESSDAALPLPGAALAQTYVELKRRAQAGDNRASCRLATTSGAVRGLSVNAHLQSITREASIAERDSAIEAEAIARAARQTRDPEQLEAICRALRPNRHMRLGTSCCWRPSAAMSAPWSALPLGHRWMKATLRDQAQWQRLSASAETLLAARASEAGEPLCLVPALVGSGRPPDRRRLWWFSA